MTNLLRSEFRKLFTTQVWFWLLVANLALTALQVVAGVAVTDSQRDYDFNTSSQIFAAPGLSFVFVMILGIIGITAEFRHQTITPTLLATPSRLAVVASKMVSYLLIGAAFAATSVALTYLIAAPWLSGKGIELGLSDHDIPRITIGAFAIPTLYALIGVGIGSLLTNQAAAITLSIVYFLPIEGIISGIPKVQAVYPYLPGAAAQALIIAPDDRDQSGYTYLPPAAGFVLFLAWVVLFAGFGVYRMRRDVS